MAELHYGTKQYCGIPERPECDATVWILEGGGKIPRTLDGGPSEFNWGYIGSGPAQLALALLVDTTGDPEVAKRHHQDFMWQVIAGFPTNKTWAITDYEIRAWLGHQLGNKPNESPIGTSTITVNVHDENPLGD
ncbi:MAG: DUF6166 domain-containing protein [Methanomicrobiales archaeon]|nr:DUF6166 domain-containing protein [Methanomicrobiales archaeon]